eukprot:TRINITY_DN10830_c0_g1_i1.p1 TRINITY_DN10830_c0_g1~~TRINITY_DN10830_c0_g1_i1.p1  ORF type:complete len:365 (+),score=65.31 TRINITY_DN10830_c0_g1_i1:298-1392(+)
MAGTLKFEECFWGGDFTSTKGFDSLHVFMKDGQTFTGDVINFFKARAALEETYAKGLQKLAKNAAGTTETGTLRAAWRVITEETMETGRRHADHAKEISTQIEKPIKDLRDQHRTFRKKLEDNLKKTAKTKAQRYSSNEKARERYNTRCRELGTAQDQSNSGTTLPPKEQDKLKAKLNKAKQAAEAADAAYKEAVEKLDEARRIWEGEMVEACHYFQEMEEERRDLLRRKFWDYANRVSNICVFSDKKAESMRLSLEGCDVDTDVQQFIVEKQTGTTRPPPILYHNFYGGPDETVTGVSPQAAAAPVASTPPDNGVSMAFADRRFACMQTCERFVSSDAATFPIYRCLRCRRVCHGGICVRTAR